VHMIQEAYSKDRMIQATVFHWYKTFSKEGNP
jgi:hypothetical protein